MSTIDGFIDEFQRRMRTVICGGQAEPQAIFMQPLTGQGKNLRPRLVFHTAALTGAVTQKVVDAAVSVECVHTASLIHDDVIDGALLRRKLPSVNALFGEKAAVLAGDYYFAAAFGNLARPGMEEMLYTLSKTVAVMCRGEMEQDINLYNPELTEADYYRHIYGKTASLFACACRLGALASGTNPAETDLLAKLGENLGFAYQICDDIWDYVGDETQMGKSPGADLASGVMTLPLICALERSEKREWLADTIRSRHISAESVRVVIGLIEECGGIDYAMRRAMQLMEDSETILAEFSPGETREELKRLCSELICLPVQYAPTSMQSAMSHSEKGSACILFA